MSCGKICQAKKKAKKAKKDAAAANKKADAAKAEAAKAGAGGTSVAAVSANVITVGHVLGVHEKVGALTPFEVLALTGKGKRNPQIMKSAAGPMVTPIQVAFGVYSGMVIAQVVGRIVKPVVKIAMQINDVVTFNFAAIGELIADVALLLVTIFVGLAPLFLNLLKNIFFSIPIDIGILTEYQLNQMKELVEATKIDIANAFAKCVKNIKAIVVINTYNNTQITKVTLGGGISDPSLISFSSLSDALSDAITNVTAPFTLDDLLAYITANGGVTDGSGNDITDTDSLLDSYTQAFEDGMSAVRAQILEALTASLTDLSINILAVDDVSSMDLEDKNKAKTVADGLTEATKRIEMLQDGEILKRQFTVSGQIPSDEGVVYDDNDLAVAAAENMLALLEALVNAASNEKETNGNNMTIDADSCFLQIFSDEVEKKKRTTIATREDLLSLEYAERFIEDNKNEFILSMMDKVQALLNVNGNALATGNQVINLDDCYREEISSQFTILKSTTLTQQTAFINASTITTTAEMETLVNSVYTNVQSATNDALISIDAERADSFGQSVCSSITEFKSKLYAEVKQAIEAGDILIAELEAPKGVSKLELKKMMDLLLTEVKKKLVAQTRDIIISEVLPCKSCKPCEQMIADMSIYISKQILISKENIIKATQGMIINDTSLDWTITDSASIDTKKGILISKLTAALSRDSGELQLEDDMLYRIKEEEKELLKIVQESLKALAD